MTGKLKSFNNNKGYGFIIGEDGKEYFIHATNLEAGVYNDNDVLTFELKNGRKGIEAIKARLA